MAADMNLAVEKLNDFNYEVWKFRIDLLLIRDGLKKIVDEPKPALPDANWIAQDGKARAIIGLSIDDSQTCHVINAASAHEMWTALKRHHTRSTLATKIHVLKKLIRKQLPENGNMAEHLAEITQLHNRLASMGDPLKDYWLVAIILSSLNDSYDGLITALESRPEADLTLDYVKGKLMDEWRRREDRSDCGGAEKALKISEKVKHEKKPKVKVCHYCGKEGHFRRECRKLEQDRKGKDKSGNDAKKVNNQKANLAVGSDEESEVCLAAGLAASGSRDDVVWFLDSGATSHMTGDASLLDHVDPTSMSIGLADGSKIPAAGVGSTKFRATDKGGKAVTVSIKQIFHVPTLTSNLLSVSKITDEGCSVNFDKLGCTISKNGAVVLSGGRVGNLYHLKPVSQKALLTLSNHNENCIHTWHRRLGHRDERAVKKIVGDRLGSGLKLVECGIKSVCEVCCEGKMTRAPFRPSESKSSAVGDLVHTDLCGPMEVSTPRGSRYFMTMLDDYSRYCVVYLLREKSECAEKIAEYTSMMRNQFGRAPKVIRCDGGGEYSGNVLKKFLADNGILLQHTAPYSPQQNGKAERKNRSLGEMLRCLLVESGLDKRFWGEAVSTANYLLNITPSSVIEGTPFERWWGKQPDYTMIRVFGSQAYVHVPDEKRRKLDVKARKLVFVGYAEGRKAWRFLDTATNRITISRDAKFLELNGCEEETTGHVPTELPRDEVLVPVLPTAVPDRGADNRVDDPEESDDDNCASYNSANEFEPVTDDSVEGSDFEGFPEDEIRRRSRRTTKGVPPRRLLEEIFFAQREEEEPRNLKEALSGPDRDQWMAAMTEELQSHKVNGTWELAELPVGRKAVGSKWIYKVKRNAAGEVIKFKSRLVAQGYSQQYGDDYDEVFAPVTKQATLRTFLAVASRKNMVLRHLDVKTAYLYGHLSEELYMRQPPGFAEKGKENLVCRLRRSIYGLKQSARCWNKRLHSVLLDLGFSQSKTDPCLYTKMVGNVRVSLLVYVDDILLGCVDASLLDQISNALKRQFDITDLGEPSYFLGLEIVRQDGKYSVTLDGYIEKTAKRFGLQDAKPAKSPMDTGFVSTKDSSPPFENNTVYRSLVGALLYVAVCARPDIAVSASILGRKVCSPTEADWTAAKRVLRYLKCTKSARIQYSSDADLIGYSDADWAGDPNTRRSTTGYVFLYAGGAVAWGSHLQHSVTLSSMESEWVALGEAGQEAVWLRRILEDLGEKQNSATCILEDNQSCIHFVNSDRTTRRSKHIETKTNYVRELCEEDRLQLSYCPTDEMVADALTKPLGTLKTQKFSKMMGLM